ncbi:hypothetical protein AHiyo1_25380 [Arthrobacter sp. Hiyo1]|nr:hypothetical protein AHiyo1_25380 [Arthrobacter sp. Hiyo1]
MVEEFCTANMTSGGSSETPTVKLDATRASGAKPTIALKAATPEGNCANACLIEAAPSTVTWVMAGSFLCSFVPAFLLIHSGPITAIFVYSRVE